jgi:hypothetical protein
MPPPLPYFKVNIFPLPFPIFYFSVNETDTTTFIICIGTVICILKAYFIFERRWSWWHFTHGRSREFRVHMKNPAQTGSGWIKSCYNFQDRESTWRQSSRRCAPKSNLVCHCKYSAHKFCSFLHAHPRENNRLLDYYKIISISKPILARANMGLDFVSGQYGCLFSRCQKYVINLYIFLNIL